MPENEDTTMTLNSRELQTDITVPLQRTLTYTHKKIKCFLHEITNIIVTKQMTSKHVKRVIKTTT